MCHGLYAIGRGEKKIAKGFYYPSYEIWRELIDFLSG